MALFEAEGLVALVLFLFWAWAIIDVIATDESRCRNLPKMVWLLIVLVLPDLGALAWVLLGRPEGAGIAPGGTTGRQRRQPGYRASGPYGPDSSPRYLAEYDVTDRRSKELDEQLAQWEESKVDTSDLDRREADLAEREAAVRARELEMRERDLKAREDDLNA